MARGIFRGIKDESEVAVVGTPHRIVFARNIRSVPKEDFGMLCNSIRGLPWDLQPGVESETERDREQSAVGCQSCRSRKATSTTDNRGAAAEKSLHHAIRGVWRSTGTRTSVSGASMQSWDSSPRITVRSAVRGLSGK